MKKYRKKISIIIFLIGISLLLYPTVGSIINKIRQLQTIDRYAESIHIIDTTEQEKMYEDAVSYNEKVYIKQKEDTRYDLGEEYKNVLKVDSSGVMGYIEIPKAKIKLPIYHGVDDSILQLGVGHVRESSLPIGTNNQNSLLMGHSGLPTSKIFTNLEKLKIDDYFIITVLGRKLYYKIYDIEVIEPEILIEKMPIIEDRDLVTLVTCTPYGVNSHRLVLHAERCEEIIPEETIITSNLLIIIVLSLIALLAIGLGIYLYKKKKKKKPEVIAPEVKKQSEKPIEEKPAIDNTPKKKKKKNNKKKKKKKKKKKQNNSKKK